MTKHLTKTFAAIGVATLLMACGSGDADDTAAETPTGTQEASATDTAQTGQSAGTREMVMGDDNAPVTLVEYASVTCPACAAFHQVGYPRLKEQYLDTGKVKLVFREYPTAPAQLSYLGSTLARCAADRAESNDAYFAMLKTLFANQRSWVSDEYRSELMSYAAQAGIGEQQFRDCVMRDDIIGAINENVRIGQNEDDVAGTPTFLVGGEKLDGYRSYDDFFALLDEKLVAAGVEPPAPQDDGDETEAEVVPQTQANPQAPAEDE